MASAKVSDSGQIKLPVEVRRRLGLKAGDRVEFAFADAGTVLLRTKRIPVEQLAGMLRRPGQKRLTLRQMEEGVSRHVRQDNERILGRRAG